MCLNPNEKIKDQGYTHRAEDTDFHIKTASGNDLSSDHTRYTRTTELKLELEQVVVIVKKKLTETMLFK